MPFRDIPGQDETARRLRATLCSERVPHAWIFAGAPGTGRMAMARELAGVLLCSDRPAPDEYCGVCRDCRLLADGNHPDFRVHGVPEGKQNFPVEVVRTDICGKAGLKPSRGTRSVFIVRDVERMNIEAYNSFLKTLEEPPAHCLFVLLTTTLHGVPETIISRCRVAPFPNLPPDVLCGQIEDDGLAADDAYWLARRCWGSPGRAREYVEAEMSDFNTELVSQLAELSLEDNFRLSDWFQLRAKEAGGNATAQRIRLQELLECVAVYYRDLAVAATCAEPDLMNRAAAAAICKAAEGHDPDEFIARARIVMDCQVRIAANANRTLALDDAFTRLTLDA
jgi:DNA polymerase III subunit delta'